ncbi:ligase-associated DNA damage response endonuclease PdeM [Aestuariibius insulae]|uniref:ligase-associated DNA damage response endonuclease PdeM n=1 Tax=Aestuariibius insulae TaxID=2058287 RepID=UPI00345F10BE
MNGHIFTLAGVTLTALPSGALWWPEKRLLTVSDLHLGKSERIARRGGTMLPPYEVDATLHRLSEDIARTDPAAVLCLGDSFDDLTAAENLSEAHALQITRLQAGRQWIWAEGNHDPGPANLGGTHVVEYRAGPLTFRHIATSETGEISGHYHPKAEIRGQSRPAFLCDMDRLIMPAYGAYTGGLRADSDTLQRLMKPAAIAILTGHRALAIPMVRMRGHAA